mgnify:CR=1 FL=1|tara:strand:- start:256 stop:480 length:225 start_codon:yes stop_codon:yes gene_type:complete
MSKIRANIKGDSGLTDSQLMKSQNLFLEKNRKALDELEEYGIMELRRRRFEASAKPPKRKRTFWAIIKEFFGVN